MYDKTMTFSVNDEKEIEMKKTLMLVYDALTKKGYNPVNQIVGYIMSGDPTYITSYNGARSLVMKVQHPLALPAVLCYTIKAIPHKERLATLHAICLQISLQSLFRIFPHASCVHIFRDISGKYSKIHKGFSPFFPSSLKKSDDAICIRQIRNRLSYFTKMLVNTSSIHSAFCFI